MSASGPKQTWMNAPHMSAFGGKADMTICGMSAFAVAIGGKADMTCCAAYIGFDPKRTFRLPLELCKSHGIVRREQHGGDTNG
jgi:hypothetical protein